MENDFFLQNAHYKFYQNIWILVPVIIFPSLWLVYLLFIAREIALYLTTKVRIEEDKIVLQTGFISISEIMILKSKINNLSIEKNLLHKQTNSFTLTIFAGNDIPFVFKNLPNKAMEKLTSLKYIV